MKNVVDLAWIAYGYAQSVLPDWVLTLIGLAILAVAVRGFLGNRSTDLARRALKRASRLTGAEREVAENDAFEAVRQHPFGLVVVADAAFAAGRTALVHTCLTQLRSLRALPLEIRRIERALDGPMPGSAMEAVLLVERLLEQGQVELAHDRLTRCIARWPSDTELRSLLRRLPRPDATAQDNS